MAPKASVAPQAPEQFPPFIGFPKEGLDFLRKLKKNNNRPWFQARKQQYEELLRFPLQCLTATLARELHVDAPRISFNPQKSIFRIYRDVRFSENKDPYKTHASASFGLIGDHGKGETPGLYVHLAPEEVLVAGGLYGPSSEQLRAIRLAIVEQPDKFLAVINNRKFKQAFGGIKGEKLQKAPLGFPKDHPMIEHLQHKQFFVTQNFAEEECYEARFAKKVAAAYRLMLPLVDWLTETTVRPAAFPRN